MSTKKKGTLTIQCDPKAKDRFHKILPFMDGLHITFDDDDECIQIQYELDNQDIETLVETLNQQDKKEFRLISHVDELPQQTKEYDLARDISKILAYDDDGEEPSPSNNEEVLGNPGTIGKPVDDKKNAANSNSKGLKSKSSSFYPPNDPRSFGMDDPSRQGQNMPGMQGQIPGNSSQKPGALYHTPSIPYHVDKFDEILDDGEMYPPQSRAIAGQPMMGPRGSATNPNISGKMKGQGMNMMGGMAGNNPMYGNQPIAPVAARGKGHPQTAAMGMNHGYSGKPGANPSGRGGYPMNMDNQVDGEYYDNMQAYYEQPPSRGGKMNQMSSRGGMKGGPAPRGYEYYDEYEEDEMYNQPERGGMMGMGPNNMGMYNQGRGGAPQGYSQGQRGEFNERMGSYNEPSAPIRGMTSRGGNMGRGGMASQNQHVHMAAGQMLDNDYFEEDYPEEEMMPMGSGYMGAGRGNGAYENYGQFQGAGGRMPPQGYPNSNGRGGGGYYPQSQGMQGMTMSVQEPFTMEGSFNSQMFDRKPGFDRSRKKIHEREKLRNSMAKHSKPSEAKANKRKGGDKAIQDAGEMSESKHDINNQEADSRRHNEKSHANEELEEEISSVSDHQPNSNNSGEENPESDRSDNDNNDQ